MAELCERGVKGLVLPGDTIEVHACGMRVKGTVLSASWYGGRDGWFIEMRSTSGKYHYWKQGSDGGSLVSHTSAQTADNPVC